MKVDFDRLFELFRIQADNVARKFGNVFGAGVRTVYERRNRRSFKSAILGDLLEKRRTVQYFCAFIRSQFEDDDSARDDDRDERHFGANDQDPISSWCY